MYKKIIILYIVWFVALMVVGAYSSHLSTYAGTGTKMCQVKDYPPYFRWDSAWYMEISRKGYDFSAVKNSSIAYFPLFPLVIKAVHGLNVIPLSDLSFFLNIIFSFLATLV